MLSETVKKKIQLLYISWLYYQFDKSVIVKLVLDSYQRERELWLFVKEYVNMYIETCQFLDTFISETLYLILFGEENVKF